MFISKWHNHDGLWKSALTLVKGQHYPEAFEIIKAIGAQTFQSYGAAIPLHAFPAHQKQLDEKEIIDMISLSNEIAELMDQRNNARAVELTTEYLDRLIQLMSGSQTNAIELYKKVFHALIKSQMTKSCGEQIIKDSIPSYDLSFSKLTSESSTDGYLTTSEAAEIGGVSDQTIRRWCEKGKFPDAFQTDGGHWRIPQKHFKMTLQQARKADAFMKKVDEDTRKQLGGDVDEFDLDIDYT